MRQLRSQEFEDEQFRPGLVANLVDDHGNHCLRVDPTISFVWGDQPPDERLGRGGFSARWRGYLLSQATGDYQLHAYFAGKLEIKLGQRVVLSGKAESATWLSSESIRLRYDWHPLLVEYSSTGDDGRLSLFWSGPQFQLEPIAPRQLFHDSDQTPDGQFERGALLVRALRCTACHEIDGGSQPAPDLANLPGNVERRWLTAWLHENGHEAVNDPVISGLMPMFDLAPDEAEAIAAFLMADGKPAPRRKRPQGDRSEGEHLFLALGCLACHQRGDLGERGLFGGGDLSAIATKRPPEFFAAWLADPSKINRNHQMPVFPLSSKERNHLAVYLATLGESAPPSERGRPNEAGQIERGRHLFVQHRCAACHATASNLSSPPLARARRLAEDTDWNRACSGQPDHSVRRPGYWLTHADQQAIYEYIRVVHGTKHRAPRVVSGQFIIAERNCLACHARGGALGIAPTLSKITAAHPELGPVIPAMTPPALDGVGDKLHDTALTEAVTRSGDVHRPWLKVRMPKFALSPDELHALVNHFVNNDRIPSRTMPQVDHPDDTVVTLAGGRLVTSDGFGCTSCHQVGGVVPDNAPLNVRGPDLSMLGQRVRQSWFERFVRNPARMVPNLEMPSVQIPVRGVFQDKLDDQLAAVWDVLNQPKFQPPKTDAVRVVRLSGVPDRNERAVVLTDVLQSQGQTYIKPLVLGLPNRHNVLFDCGTGRLADWWIGDVARQRTKGKTWYWEAAGTHLVRDESAAAEIILVRHAATHEPLIEGQFVTDPDRWKHLEKGVQLEYRLIFGGGSTQLRDGRQILRLTQTFTAIHSQRQDGISGFQRQVTVSGVETGSRVKLRVLGKSRMVGAFFRDAGRTLVLPGPEKISIRVREPVGATIDSEGQITCATVSRPNEDVVFLLEYRTGIPVDQFPVIVPAIPAPAVMPLDVVPGYDVVRLPMTEEIMPTALAWQPDGTLILTSLKGRVWLARDTDGDGLEDQLQSYADELAAPFGAVGYGQYVDVINKYALLRLYDDDQDGRADRTENLASGWGHTTDYHDWAVGLPREEAGDYYVALSCQQDERSPAAAHLRGTVLKLVPREPSPNDPRQFEIQQLSAGHRFPIGIARNRAGALFVTDNQGNYNPFNELNHVIRGARYGFVNAWERGLDFKSTLTAPAVDIPHPWTRSVNGICFLYTPVRVKEQLGQDLFGPFEGQLMGCEYDTRRLIRISVQRVGDTYQGAAYPFSFDEPPVGPPFLGPLVCAVAPDGDLYVGGIRDSGWGGANNIGEVVRLRPKQDGLPAGIAEIRAVREGFTIDFTIPIDPQRALQRENYFVSSFTRVSTPAYGGPDIERRTERIESIALSNDRLRVVLRLSELRPGFVYEFRLKPLTHDSLFHPAEAYYTLRTIPAH